MRSALWARRQEGPKCRDEALSVPKAYSQQSDAELDDVLSPHAAAGQTCCSIETRADEPRTPTTKPNYSDSSRSGLIAVKKLGSQSQLPSVITFTSRERK
jgi:hypothetical protein